MRLICIGKIIEEKNRGKTENISLAHYYIIAEALNDEKLKDRIIDAIIAKLGALPEPTSTKPWFPSAEFVNTIYRGTKPESYARRFMFDVYAKGEGSRWLLDVQSRKSQVIWHAEFLMELAVELFFWRDLSAEMYRAFKDPETGDMRPYRTESCLYHHNHKEGEDCGGAGG